jgi:hypothetical protein
MADRPLFQNTDEQEQAYAPQQRPEGDAQAMVQADEGIGAGAAAGDDAQGAISGGGGGGAMLIPGPGASGMLQGNAGDVSGTTAYGASPSDLDDDDNRS